MRRLAIFVFLAASAALVVGLAGAEMSGTREGAEPISAPRVAGETVACRVLEAHTSGRDGITVVIFHQRNKADGPRLGDLIRALDGKSVRFEQADAKPHSATLFRLKSCFGRGLLVFSSARARLEDKDEFLLRVR